MLGMLLYSDEEKQVNSLNNPLLFIMVFYESGPFFYDIYAKLFY